MNEHTNTKKPTHRKNGLHMIILWWLFGTITFLNLSGCQETEKVKSIMHEEVGRCDNEPGTLIRVVSTDWWTRVEFDFLKTIFWFSYQPKQDHFCIPDLPIEKIKNLTEQEKEKLRIDYVNRGLFKTTQDKIKGTSYYTPPKSSKFLDLQDLVRRGSELAFLELHLVDSYKIANSNYPLKFKESNPYYQQLKQLAYSGDAEAMCLYSKVIPAPFKGYEDLTLYEFRKLNHEGKVQMHQRRWVEGPDDKWGRGRKKAAQMGSIECGEYYAGLSAQNMTYDSIPLSEVKKTYLNAATKGSYPATSGVAIFYRLGINGFEKNLAKSKCWMQKYNQLDVSKPFTKDQVNQIEPLARNRHKGNNFDVYWDYLQTGIKIHPDLKNLPVYDPNNYCEEIKGAVHEQ